MQTWCRSGTPWLYTIDDFQRESSARATAGTPPSASRNGNAETPILGEATPQRPFAFRRGSGDAEAAAEAPGGGAPGAFEGIAAARTSNLPAPLTISPTREPATAESRSADFP